MVNISNIEKLKWVATLTYLIGMALTAFNIFPLNLIFSAIGGTLWCIAGFIAKDKPLILVEMASAMIYLVGLVHWSIK
jgi:hypothetical protein